MSGSKNVRFGLVLSEQARERLDRLAKLQRCSRAELIDRALVNLELKMRTPLRELAPKPPSHPDLVTSGDWRDWEVG